MHAILKKHPLKAIIYSIIMVVAGVFVFTSLHNDTPEAAYNTAVEAEKFPHLEHFLVRAYPDKAPDMQAYKNAMERERSRLNSKVRSHQSTDIPWTLEGPKNIGGRINAVLADPENPQIIYAGCTNGGIFKTTDGGTNWFPVFDDNPSLSISALVFDPDNSSIIYAGTGDRNISGYPFMGDGIYKSEDAGETWTHLGLSEQSIVSRIAVNPVNSDIIYAATMGVPFVRNNERGLYKTTDGGEHWEQILFLNEDAGVIDLVMNPDDPDVLYAAGWNRIRNAFESLIFGEEARIYKTIDGGNTWTTLSGGLPQGEQTRIGMCMSNQNPDKLYAVYLDQNFQLANIYKTEDAGENWSAIPTSGIDDNLMGGFGWYFGQIRVNPVNDEEIYVLGVRMMKTSNGGTTWDYCPPYNYWDQHVDKHDLFFIDENTMISATDGGLYYSSNGGSSWTDLEDIPNTQFYRITYDPHNPGYYAGGTQDNGTIYGNESTINNWEHRLGGDGFQALFDYNDPDVGYAMTQNGGIYYHNGGSWYDWYYFTDGIDEDDRRSWDMPLIMSKNNPDVLYTGTYRIYKVENAPDGTWQVISEDLTNGTNSRYHVISAIEDSKHDVNRLYAGTTDGRLWTTENGGSGWQEITGNLPGRFIASIKVSPDNAATVFVAHSGYKVNDYIPHIHKSTNNGTSWTDISGNLPQFAVNDLYVLEGHNDSVLFAGTDGGVYLTFNGGDEWERLGNNMPLIQVYDMDYEPENARLIAGTYARSMYSFPVDSLFEGSDPVGVHNAENQQYRIYPNPVKDIILIEREDMNNHAVIIRLYNTAGVQILSKISNSSQPVLSVNLSALNSGIYTLVIGNNETTFTKKIVKLNQ